MIKVYDLGQGGKHRDDHNARTWRKLTTELAAMIRRENPDKAEGLVLLQAEHAAISISHLHNRAAQGAR